ncbi:MAG: CBS domain-containing protein [Rhodanobacteraceae bacterium]|nr:MAG: CBS domain-containing protein [Rhodanobacteraceae bacterium]
MSYRSLQTIEPATPAPLPVRTTRAYPTLSVAAPAGEVLVDFCQEYAATVEPHQHLDATLKLMQDAGVRALLVVADGRVTGLITAYDIQGEKPVQFVQSSDCVHHPKCRHEDVEVADIMTPIEELPVLRMEDLATASVGDVMETFRQTGHTHLVVMEASGGATPRIRGLISRAQVERQLGLVPSVSPLPQIEREIARLFPLVEGA